MTIFQAGDVAIYHGSSTGRGETFLMPGDVVTVAEPNEDYEGDVKLSTGLVVPAELLEWTGSEEDAARQEATEEWFARSMGW